MVDNNLSKPKAIIVGAGIAGLAAAGILSPLCESIVIIDKDALPDSAKPRKSTVQSHHLHSLLIAGQNILENIFPGISQNIANAGGVVLRAGIDQSIFEFGAWMPKRDLGLTISAQSRSLLESVVRQRVNQLKNVTIMDSTRVVSLAIEDNAVCGVHINDSAGNQSLITGDYVVDASGLSGTLAQKLNAQCPKIESTKEKVSSKIAYVTAIITKPENWRSTKENVLVVAEPHQTCGGALLDIENDCWVVSMNGRNGVEPPTDIEGWKDYARQLPSPAIWERIKDCAISDKLHKFSKAHSYLRRFDLVENLPTAYFPIGDTINSVNPTFGQGMALALGHAEELGQALVDGLNDDSQRDYLKRATKRSQKAWRQTVAYESMFAEMDENSRNKFQLLQSLVLNKHKRALHDEKVHLELFKRAQMLD
ncbi:MAG: 2-polyprenyl-6-methoxyphenol hydroxylase-like FAD-dependent oxidoreductase [Flavobacteriales bacterium]|jgi:2-polyprenyl-6-methoxyphenol hydroxylase-like FAD-dependent oxidoreductase